MNLCCPMMSIALISPLGFQLSRRRDDGAQLALFAIPLYGSYVLIVRVRLLVLSGLARVCLRPLNTNSLVIWVNTVKIHVRIDVAKVWVILQLCVNAVARGFTYLSARQSRCYSNLL